MTLTDTAGFKNSIVAWDHLIFSRVRAIENNSFMIHSGNNGISALIDPNGRILIKTELVKKEVIYGSIYFDNNKSFFMPSMENCYCICIMVLRLFSIVLSGQG